jgi:hypothetical protein
MMGILGIDREHGIKPAAGEKLRTVQIEILLEICRGRLSRSDVNNEHTIPASAIF